MAAVPVGLAGGGAWARAGGWAGAAAWWRAGGGARAGGLLDWLLRAVPKKRTTHAKKRMRMSQKYLKPDCSIKRCESCGAWKKPHTYCLPSCRGRRDAGLAL
jgi:ribosomal protein L32